MSRAYVCWRCRASQSARQLQRQATRQPPWRRALHSSGSVQSSERTSAAADDTTYQARPAPSESTPLNLWDAYQQHRSAGSTVSEAPPPGVLSGASLKAKLGPLGRPIDADILQVLARPGKPAAEVWNELTALPYFRSAALPEAMEVRFRKAPALRTVFLSLLRASLFGLDGGLPPYETVVDTFCRRGLFNYTLLHDVMRLALPEIQATSFGTAAEDGSDCTAVLRRLLWTWKYVANGPFGHLAVQETQSGWANLLAAAELEQGSSIHGPVQRGYIKRFRDVMNGKIDKVTEEPLAAHSALLFLCIEKLTSQNRIPADLEEDCNVLTSFMLGILHAKDNAGNITLPRIGAIMSRASDVQLRNHKRDIIEAWNWLQRKHTVIGAELIGETSAPSPAAASIPSVPAADRWRGLLNRAAEQGNRRQTLKLWLDFQDIALSWSDHERSDVLAEFLWAFAKIGQASRATEVWQSLEKYGVTPTLNHWTPMLEVCRASHDLSSLKGIWLLIQDSGTIPANQTWTIYIKALLVLRDWQAALEAVQKMGQQWRSVADDPTQITSKNLADYQPSMIPINAAISGLLRMGHAQDVTMLLDWAHQRSIKRTTDTYNILLRSAIRRQHHQPQRPRELLAEMKAAGCEPDVITFTIFIDGLLRNPHSSFLNEPPEAQQEAIFELLAGMRALGLRPNAQTYTTLLHSFLDTRNAAPNLPVAQALLDSMGDDGLQPGAHIFTILATHYFGQEPPALAAVEALQARVEAAAAAAGPSAPGATAPPVAVDRGFYDRLVQGYAAAGETEKMLAALRRRAERPPSWKTLRLALRALVEREEWTLAADLVAQVEAERDMHYTGQDKNELRGWKATVQMLRDDHRLGEELGRSAVRKVVA